ncbi:hypothetical protein FHS18_000541 [Paenibacillus phyllosphaerae]|uniref:Uncharacterized protein n=1 Tax=Paenibacillus phyllosphaerae TaxID=274593 RepID=A0A7W5ATJ9_9BACL|nr:hypothetical protein [Paenibacillus phyllosphaerae]
MNLLSIAKGLFGLRPSPFVLFASPFPLHRRGTRGPRPSGHPGTGEARYAAVFDVSFRRGLALSLEGNDSHVNMLHSSVRTKLLFELRPRLWCLGVETCYVERLGAAMCLSSLDVHFVDTLTFLGRKLGELALGAQLCACPRLTSTAWTRLLFLGGYSVRWRLGRSYELGLA